MTILKLSIPIFLMPLTLMAAMFCVLGCQPETPITYPSGGYDYPSKDSVIDTSFFYYPLQHVFTRRDSFKAASVSILNNAFDEPNLSIKPMEKDVFRFEIAGKIRTAIITFNRDEMVIKTGGNKRLYDYLLDENRLTRAEKKDYHFFEWRDYPYYDSSEKERSRETDSMLKANPRLLDLNYYRYLSNKVMIPNQPHYQYNLRKIPLSLNEYKRLVSIINNSGYWKLPYKIKCNTEFWDGYGFSLEANTKTKYNCVAGCSCDEDRSKLAATCQEIINYAGLEKPIDLLEGIRPKKPEELRPLNTIVQDITVVDVERDSSQMPKKEKSKHSQKK